MVVIMILTPSSVRSCTWRELFAPRLRCPGKRLVVCSGDEMRIGMGRGAEDATVVRDSMHDISEVDIISGLQV